MEETPMRHLLTTALALLLCAGCTTSPPPATGTPTATTSHKFGWPGPSSTVTAASATATAGIVWAIDAHRALNSGVAALWAFDATSMSCLYTTDQSVGTKTCTRKGASTDVPSGIAVKFSVPSVVNGKVYVGSTGSINSTRGSLNIYGIN